CSTRTSCAAATLRCESKIRPQELGGRYEKLPDMGETAACVLLVEETRHLIPQATTYPRARWALAMGIASVVLIWPVGIVLGPLALLFGIGVVRRINGSGGALAGARQARAGAICGGIVIGLYLLALLAELAAILLTGSAIPLGEPAG